MWGRVVGLLASLGVASYLWLNLTIQSRFLAFYLLLLAMTYLLTNRIAHAVVLGYYRSRGGMIEPSPPQEPE
ncbi:MAG: hypothetical protein PVG79_10475 [Gemmatimonadales bacterium]|jgi:hypothetical protein